MFKVKVQVTGDKGLQRVFDSLDPILQKTYMPRLVTKVAGKVRTDARKLAPSGKQTGTTQQQSEKVKGAHRPLRKNIRTSKRIKRDKASGSVRRTVYGPPQMVPLLQGHKLVAWGNSTGASVRPSRQFTEIAMKKHQRDLEKDGVPMLQEFIKRDVKRLGQKQAQGVLSKAGGTRLEAIRLSGLL